MGEEETRIFTTKLSGIQRSVGFLPKWLRELLDGYGDSHERWQVFALSEDNLRNLFEGLKITEWLDRSNRGITPTILWQSTRLWQCCDLTIGISSDTSPNSLNRIEMRETLFAVWPARCFHSRMTQNRRVRRLISRDTSSASTMPIARSIVDVGRNDSGLL